MKYIFQLITMVLFILFGVMVELLVPAGGVGISTASASGLLVNLFTKDPQKWQQWEKEAFKQGEAKTEFNESEIGTTFANDGPKPSQQTIAPPILYHQDHTQGGREINIRYSEPLFTDTSDALNAGRVQTQSRIGHEYKMNQDHVIAIVDEHHIGVTEKDVQAGEQFSANATTGEVMKKFVEHISDFDATRGDLEVFYGFLSGYSKNTHLASCVRKGLSNGAVPVADPDNGHLRPMSEHPDSYAYIIESDSPKMEPIAYHATQATHSANLVAGLSKITPAAKPGLDFLRRVRSHARKKHMIPCAIRTVEGKTHQYYLLLVSDRVKAMIEQDDNAFELYVKAYQGMVDKNPLLQEGDMLYKDLIIRESKRLNEEFFSAKTSFNATGHTSGATDASFNIVSSIKDGSVSITEGEIEFAAESAAATAFDGRDNAHLVGRCFLMGANSVIKCAGKTFEMKPMEITDYGANSGIGRTKFFGTQRIEKYKAGASGLTFNSVPQSAQFFVFQGD